MYRVNNATAVPALPAPSAGGPNPNRFYTDGDPTSGVPATIVEAEHLNMIQEELSRAIEDDGTVLDNGDNTQLRALVRKISGYDISFMAGYDGDGVGADVTVRPYGVMILTRAINILSEVGYAEVVPTGSAVIFDVLLNGVSIYSTNPQIADGANTLTPGVLTSFPNPLQASAGDRIKFMIMQIGSTLAAQEIMFSIKGQV